MNKILPLALALLFFGCDNANRNSENAGTNHTPTEDNSPENVQEGAGSEISPQLEGIEDSANRLQVDTISSAQDARQRK